LAGADLLGLQFELLAGVVRASKLSAMIVVFSLLGAAAHAVESTVRVQALFNSDALVTKFLLPFRLTNLAQNSDVISFRVLSAAEDCGLMRDPFRGEIFLLKCERPASPRLEFTLNQTGHPVIIHFGPIAVNGADGGTAPLPTPTPTPTPLPTGGVAGKNLYNAHCSGCHPGVSKSGRSRFQIDSALSTVSSMISLRSQLNSTDVLNLETYLANPGAY